MDVVEVGEVVVEVVDVVVDVVVVVVVVTFFFFGAVVAVTVVGGNVVGGSVVVVGGNVVGANVVVVPASRALRFSLRSRAMTASAAFREDSARPDRNVSTLELNSSSVRTSLVSMSCGLNQSMPPGSPW